MKLIKKRETHSLIRLHAMGTTLLLLGVAGLLSLSGCSGSSGQVEVEPAHDKWAAAKLAAAKTTTSVPLPRAEVTPSAVEEMAATTSPAVGKLAPSFALLNQDRKSVSLQGLRGKWVVLYFYPKDDTPGCSCEATEFTELLSQFREMNAQVLGINQDTLESHRMFRRKYALELDLLSDPQAATMRSYGAYVNAQFGAVSSPRVIRTTFLIDPNGRVQFHWPEVIPQGHAKRVKDKLTQLQAG